MGIVSAVALYFIIWWLVFYIVLTLGNRAPMPDEARPAGSERGAPAAPRLWRRVGITTVVAGAVLAAFYGVLNSGLTLDDIPLPSPPRLGEG